MLSPQSEGNSMIQQQLQLQLPHRPVDRRESDAISHQSSDDSPSPRGSLKIESAIRSPNSSAQQSPTASALTPTQTTAFPFKVNDPRLSMGLVPFPCQYVPNAPSVDYQTPALANGVGPSEPRKVLPIAPKPDSSPVKSLASPSKEHNIISKIFGRPRKNSLGKTVFDPSTNLIKVGDQNCRLLWQFLLHALMDSNYKDFIEWADKDRLIFRIKNSDALAKCWGRQKNLPNMNYEKMSRAMRFYYKSNLIGRVPGRRLLYRFLMQPEEIRRMKSGIPGRHSRALENPIDIIKEPDSYSDVGSIDTAVASEDSIAEEGSAADELMRDPLSPTEDTVDDSVIELSDEETKEEMEEEREYFSHDPDDVTADAVN